MHVGIPPALAFAVVLAAASPAVGPAADVPDTASLILVLAGQDVYSPAVALDGRTVYVTVRTERSNRRQRLASLTYRSGSWSAPEPLPFTRPGASDRDPSMTPDGRFLIFSTNRPGGEGSPFTLWRAERTAGGWGEPAPIPGLEGLADAKGPTAAADGTLLFSAPGSGGDGADLWMARPRGDGYEPPVRLAELSSPGLDLDPWISPRGDLLVFASDRGAKGRDADLYVATRSAAGWSAPERLPQSGRRSWDEGPVLAPAGDLLLWSRGWGELRVAPWARPDRSTGD